MGVAGAARGEEEVREGNERVGVELEFEVSYLLSLMTAQGHVMPIVCSKYLFLV